MKKLLAPCLLIFSSAIGWTSELILPYSAFGPQVAAYELIGMEWWQWDPHGDGSDRDYPIKVVVFWDQTLVKTMKKHPVDEAKQQDFRYVKYSKAIEHMERTIMGFKEAQLDASPIEQALAQLKSHKAEKQGGPLNP